jgi:hypothetical protein
MFATVRNLLALSLSEHNVTALCFRNPSVASEQLAKSAGLGGGHVVVNVGRGAIGARGYVPLPTFSDSGPSSCPGRSI